MLNRYNAASAAATAPTAPPQAKVEATKKELHCCNPLNGQVWWIESWANPSQAIITLLQGKKQGIRLDSSLAWLPCLDEASAGGVCAVSWLHLDQGSDQGSRPGKQARAQSRGD